METRSAHPELEADRRADRKTWLYFACFLFASFVVESLSDKESFVVTEDARQTFAGPADNTTKYNLVYCSTPQKLYLMKFRLADSHAVFMQAREKYEKRYGKPEGQDYISDNLATGNWEDAVISLIWDINEFETILLTHGKNGTSAEFQDVSVCQ